MKSLEELNQYALSPITYIDDRPAGVFFDRGATVDQEITVNENTTFFFPYGIEIEDITQYDVAQMEYVIDLSVFDPDVVYISFPTSVTLPSHITVTRVGNVFTISEIRNKADWDLVKTVRVQPPFSVSGFKPLEGKLRWFADGQAVTRTEAVWDVQLELVPVEYFSSVAAETYVANQQDDQIAVPSIIVDPDEFDPDWTLEISPSVLGAVELIYSTNPSEAETSWNASTRTFSITGDKTAVNNTLEDLEVDYGRSDADFIMTYLLRNNYNLVTENQVQTFESRDFISDMDAATGLSGTLHTIFGGRANFTPFTTFDDVDFIRYRDPGAITAPVEATVAAVGNATFDASVTMSAVFEQDPILNFDLEIESTMTCEAWGGEAIEIDLTVTSSAIDWYPWDLASPSENGYIEVITDTGENVVLTPDDNRLTHELTLSQGLHNVLITGYADNSEGIDYEYPGFTSNNYTFDIERFGGDVSNKMKIGTNTGLRCTSIPSYLHPNFTDLSSMFNGFGNATNSFFAPVVSWNTSNVENMTSFFDGQSNFNQDISGWNTSSATTMNSMFDGATTFDQNISSWDTSSVTDMRYMFSNARAFDQSLSNWDVSNVTSFYRMFYSAILFNGDLTNWDISSATSIGEMFAYSAFNNSSLNNWTIPAGMTYLIGTFKNAASFNQDISGWDLSGIDQTNSMFEGASSFNQNISSWDMSNVRYTYNMFKDATSFNQPIGTWDISSLLGTQSMFEGATSFNQSLNAWDIQNIQIMDRMFFGATSYNQPMDNWYPRSVYDSQYLGYFLYGATAYNQDLTGWCVPNFASAPFGFSTNSGLSSGNLPVWGTCPWTGTISGHDYYYTFTDADGISWKSYVFHNSNTGSNARTATVNTTSGWAQVAIVGAGGHGGGHRSTDTAGGGGGGGGVVTNIIDNTFAKIPSGTYNFTIGQADTSYVAGNSGGSTTAFGYTVPGGGNGASYGFNSSPRSINGADGANGGGAVWNYGVETKGNSTADDLIVGDFPATAYLNKYDGHNDSDDYGFMIGSTSGYVGFSGGGASGNFQNRNTRAYNQSQSSIYYSWNIPTSGATMPFGGEGVLLPTAFANSGGDTYGSGGGGAMYTNIFGYNHTITSYGGYNAGNGAAKPSNSSTYGNASNAVDGYGGGGGGGAPNLSGTASRGGCGSVVIRVQA